MSPTCRSWRVVLCCALAGLSLLSCAVPASSIERTGIGRCKIAHISHDTLRTALGRALSIDVSMVSPNAGRMLVLGETSWEIGEEGLLVGESGIGALRERGVWRHVTPPMPRYGESR